MILLMRMKLFQNQKTDKFIEEVEKESNLLK